MFWIPDVFLWRATASPRFSSLSPSFYQLFFDDVFKLGEATHRAERCFWHGIMCFALPPRRVSAFAVKIPVFAASGTYCSPFALYYTQIESVTWSTLFPTQLQNSRESDTTALTQTGDFGGIHFYASLEGEMFCFFVQILMQRHFFYYSEITEIMK